jgi:YidC/Oxa1 family membrane protein insertase
MQAMQPRLQAIKEKYKNDRQAPQLEMMRLQQEEGFNPLAGCLPMLLQIPIFIALFHVLRHVSSSASLCHPIQVQHAKLSLYGFTATQTCSAADAKLFGAPLAGSLRDSRHSIESTFVPRHAGSVVAPHRNDNQRDGRPILSCPSIGMPLLELAARVRLSVCSRPGNK